MITSILFMSGRKKRGGRNGHRQDRLFSPEH